jgi:hypothetical protein
MIFRGTQLQVPANPSRFGASNHTFPTKERLCQPWPKIMLSVNKKLLISGEQTSRAFFYSCFVFAARSPLAPESVLNNNAGRARSSFGTQNSTCMHHIEGRNLSMVTISINGWELCLAFTTIYTILGDPSGGSSGSARCSSTPARHRCLSVAVRLRSLFGYGEQTRSGGSSVYRKLSFHVGHLESFLRYVLQSHILDLNMPTHWKLLPKIPRGPWCSYERHSKRPILSLI